MTKWMKHVVALAGASVLAVGAFFLSANALTEAETRTALVSWMKGDATVANPWLAVQDFVTERSVVAVDTFADLVGVADTRRVQGSLVYVRGHESATGSGGGLFYYAPTSSATTNTYAVSAAATAGRFIATGPHWYTASQDWDPPAVSNNVATSVLFTNFGTLPKPIQGDFVLVSHTAVLSTSTNLTLVALAATNTVVITLNNDSATEQDLGTGAVRIAWWKQ